MAPAARQAWPGAQTRRTHAAARHAVDRFGHGPPVVVVEGAKQMRSDEVDPYPRPSRAVASSGAAALGGRVEVLRERLVAVRGRIRALRERALSAGLPPRAAALAAELRDEEVRLRRRVGDVLRSGGGPRPAKGIDAS
jgi:hypothetical protein